MQPITDIGQLDFAGTYSYADYLTWQFRERVELILGKIFKMSPAPSAQHQYIVSVLHASLFQFLKGSPCTVFPAPFDVILPVSEIKDTVVQPDITVVCNQTKITSQGCMGAPDLVVEVVSKSSVSYDLHEKYQVYEKAGVKEYWIVQPTDRTLTVFVLDESGRFQPTKPLTSGDIVRSISLTGFELALDEVFRNIVMEPQENYEASINRI